MRQILSVIKVPSNTPKPPKTLKADPFGAIELGTDGRSLIRNTDRARWWARPVARHLARREALALIALDNLKGIPRLCSWNGRRLERDFLPGNPLHEAGNLSADWHASAFRLLCRMHRHNIAHNDMAKEANCLVMEDGSAGYIDFQLAVHSPRRGRLFRLLAREDLRHLLKHKRCYFPQYLTARERTILATPSLAAKLWMGVYKPLYLWLTRSILRWPERTGPAERVYKNTDR